MEPPAQKNNSVNQVRTLYLPPIYQDSADYGRLILRDGTTESIRLAQPGDRHGLRAFFVGLSLESRVQRFFSIATPDEKWLDLFCDASNPRAQLTLVVTRTLAGASRIIAVGSYVARGEGVAEIAMAVDDAFQGKGLGTLLFERLAVWAAQHGCDRIWAVTSVENQPMIAILRRSGFPVKERVAGGYVEADLTVEATEASVARSEVRDRIFTTLSLRPFFKPNAVAVVGASRNPRSIGQRIFKALTSQFHGTTHGVNPRAEAIDGTQVYPSVRDLPGPIDLAVIVVPRDAVLKAVDDCAERGVRALVVITA